MTVKELIEYLSTIDPSLPVCHAMYSEYCMLDATDIVVKKLCVARPDEWIQDARPDKPTIEYLVFPGN